MASYWTKIGVGALTVFGVGLTGVTVVKKGVAELKTHAMGPVVEQIRQVPSLLNFRLDGRRIGKVRSVDVSNEGDWGPKSVAMTVAIDEGRAPADLESCQLSIDDMGHRDAAFQCLDAADAHGLVEIGEVRFEPSGITRPLLVEEHQVRRLERSDLRGLKANIHSSDAGRVTGQAEFDVESHRGRRERGTVTLDAADGRALIEVKGIDGREIFRLRADERGVSINAKDGRGSNILKLLAGESGVHINVDPR